MEIKIGNYKIRSYQKRDIEALVKYANNYNIYRWLKDSFPYPYTEDDAIVWLANAAALNPETNFALADANELIGSIGLKFNEDVLSHNAEIGYWLAEPFWGKNIVTEAVRELTKYTFNNFNINRIFAGVFEGNPASGRVLKKCNYKLEAVLRKAIFKENKYLDQYIYSILKEEFIKLYE